MNTWDLCWAKVCFDDDPNQFKIRPVIYLGQLPNGYHRVMYCTSQTLKYLGYYDCLLVDWETENLKKESTARCNRVFDINNEGVKSRIGKLTDLDKYNILEIIDYIKRRKRR